MTLTKKEAIRRHRLMWNWIAQTSIQEQRCVTKEEAFKHFGWENIRNTNFCWCCAYAMMKLKMGCSRCPIKWPDKYCTNLYDLLYDKFIRASKYDHYIKSAEIAYQIAELPERKD